jgi:hypothetical protein
MEAVKFWLTNFIVLKFVIFVDWGVLLVEMSVNEISYVHLNLSSKFALESRLRTHHSCKSVRFKQLIRYPHSAFTIESSTITLRIHLNERTIPSQ